ncbi:hypothetical protein ACFL1S_09390 [Pseudomonadota bacterium]
MRIVLLFTSVLLCSLRAVAAEGLQVAEYRADVDDVSWSAGVEGVDLYGDADSLAVDADGESSIGPRHYFSPNSFAQLFYSLDPGGADEDLYPGLGIADVDTQRTGLSQTWFFARRKAQITLGYGFEQSATEELYDDYRAHSLVFRSRFPLFLGLSARIHADYIHNSYDSYLGYSNVGSDTRLFQASIDQPLGRGLLGELRFSYTDENFDDSDLSYSRYVWGLNLKYRY